MPLIEVGEPVQFVASDQIGAVIMIVAAGYSHADRMLRCSPVKFLRLLALG